MGNWGVVNLRLEQSLNKKQKGGKPPEARVWITGLKSNQLLRKLRVCWQHCMWSPANPSRLNEKNWMQSSPAFLVTTKFMKIRKNKRHSRRVNSLATLSFAAGNEVPQGTASFCFLRYTFYKHAIAISYLAVISSSFNVSKGRTVSNHITSLSKKPYEGWVVCVW